MLGEEVGTGLTLGKILLVGHGQELDMQRGLHQLQGGVQLGSAQRELRAFRFFSISIVLG